MCGKLQVIMSFCAVGKQPGHVAASLTPGERLPAVHLAVIRILGIVFDAQFERVAAIAIEDGESAVLRIQFHQATVFPICRRISNHAENPAMGSEGSEWKSLAWNIGVLRTASQGIVTRRLANALGKSS